MRPVCTLLLLPLLLLACGPAPEVTPSEAASPTQTATPSPTLTPTSTPTPTPTPSPTPTPAPATTGTYLALGDSLAVGVGASRRELGYVGRLFASLADEPGDDPRPTTLTNLAVSGETSTSMIRDGQLAGAIEAIRSAEPPVTLVTLDIGGNDLLRLLGTEACASAPQGPDCQRLLALTLADFASNYRQIALELTADLPPGARMAVMTYFNPFSGTDAAHEAAADLALLGTDSRLDCEADEPAARGMNDLIACIGEDLGAIAVDVQPAFIEMGLELTHIGSEDIHANDAGYAVIADAFLAALRD